MLHRILLLALWAVISVGPASGQPVGVFLKYGLGYGLETIRDQAMSPVSYSGHLAKLDIGYYDQNDKWLSQLDLAALGGIQKPDLNRAASSRKTLSGLARLHYSISYRVTHHSDWRLFAGLSNYNLFDYRRHSEYTNNESNYMAFFSLGPFAEWQKDFSWLSQNWGYRASLGIPVVGYYLRPGYVKPFYNEGIGSKGLTWLEDLRMLHLKHDLIYHLANGNQLRLVYQWEFGRFNSLNQVEWAGHYLGITSIFKL